MADNEKIRSSNLNSDKPDGRKNNGRIKGSTNKATAEAKVAKARFVQRINKNADKLFNAQLSIATGTQMLFVIKTDSKGVRRKPEMITDPEIISQFLDENEGVDGTLGDGSEYYFMTTTRPDNAAIESLINRSFGKAKESVDVTSNGETISPYVELTVEELRKLAGK